MIEIFFDEYVTVAKQLSNNVCIWPYSGIEIFYSDRHPHQLTTIIHIEVAIITRHAVFYVFGRSVVFSLYYADSCILSQSSNYYHLNAKLVLHYYYYLYDEFSLFQ